MQNTYPQKILATLATLLVYVALQAQEPQVWLKADDMGEETGVWQDASGNGNNARTTNSIDRTGQINFNPSVGFSAIEDTLAVNYDIANKDYIKVFTVFKGVADTTGQYIWSFGNIQRQSLELGNGNVYNYPKTYTYTGGDIGKPVISTVDRYNGNNATERAERFFLGNGFEDSTATGNFTGEIAEIMVYAEEQETTAHNGVESYLAIKYGICLNGDYYDSEGETLWAQEDNEGFSENVFAIGRNDDFGLEQKQSTSAESDILTIGANTIETDNASNGTTLRDGTYLFISDNGEDGNEGLSSGYENGSYFISNKVWKANETGDKMHRVPLVFKAGTAEIFDTLTGDFCLIRDANKDGEFSELETVQPDSISTEGYAYFSGIKLCSAKSGVDYFTFAQTSPLEVETSYSPPACDSAFGSATVNLSGGTSPYSYKLSDEDGKLIREWQSTGTEETIDSLEAGSYTVSIVDTNNNRYAFETGSALEAVTPDLGTSTIYSYTGSPITIDLCGSFGEGSCSWYFEGAEISDTCKVELAEEGGYTIKAETGGCTITEEFYILDNTAAEDTANTTSTDGVDRGDILTISPNPAQKNFGITIQLDTPGDACLYITDITGAAVENKELGNVQQYTYHGKIKATGTYFVTLIADNKKIAVKKLVIQ